MKKATIKGIAEELNLSRNTVAKALANNEAVAYETRQRVYRKALAVGYKKLPPEIENNLSEQPIQLVRHILVIAKRDISSYWDEIALGVFEKTDRSAFNVLYQFISAEEEAQCILPVSFKNDEVAGVIFLNIFSDAYVNKIIEYGLPMIFLDSPRETGKYLAMGDVLLVDGYEKIYALTMNMISNGKKQLAFIGDVSYCRSIYDRYLGFLQALQDAGLKAIPSYHITQPVAGRYYHEHEVENALSSLNKMPEGIICANDDIAYFVINYCKKKGIKIPEKIEVTGFDNKRDYQILEPTITTVEVNKNGLGARLAQELVWRLNNPKMPNETITINTSIKYGQSSLFKD